MAKPLDHDPEELPRLHRKLDMAVRAERIYNRPGQVGRSSGRKDDGRHIRHSCTGTSGIPDESTEDDR